MEAMEIYWEIISYSYALLNTILMGYFLYRFAGPFMKNKKGAVYAGIVYSAAMQALYIIPCELNNFTAYGFGTLTAFFVMCRKDKRNYRQKIFIAVTFFSLRWLSSYMTNLLTQNLFYIMVYNQYWIKHPVLQVMFFAGANILDLFILYLIMKINTGAIVKAYIYKSEELTVKEMFMMIIPSAAKMAEYRVILYYRNCIEPEVTDTIPDIYNGLTFLYYALSILEIVVITVFFQNIRARQEEKLQNSLLAMQIDSVKKHIGQVEGLYQNIRSMKHDMANHIHTLEKLYEEKKTEEARAYSSELQAAFSETAGKIKSGNPVTDVILQEWKREAERENILFRTEFYYPAASDINAFDISVILNNALQNALENVKTDGTGYISIVSWHRKNAYMIEIKNSFTGKLQWDMESGLPVTSKEKTESHGYGLGNIRRVAQKYHGDIDIAQKDEEFCLSIMLMME